MEKAWIQIIVWCYNAHRLLLQQSDRFSCEKQLLPRLYCTSWKNRNHTEEYHKWLEYHEEECIKNYEGSSEKVEVDSMKEMFLKSEKKFGVKYSN